MYNVRTDLKALFPYTCSASLAYQSGQNVYVTGGGSGWKVPCMGINHMKIVVSNSGMNPPTIQSDTGVALSAGNNVDVSAYNYINVSIGGGVMNSSVGATITFSIVD